MGQIGKVLLNHVCFEKAYRKYTEGQIKNYMIL